MGGIVASPYSYQEGGDANGGGSETSPPMHLNNINNKKIKKNKNKKK